MFEYDKKNHKILAVKKLQREVYIMMAFSLQNPSN